MNNRGLTPVIQDETAAATEADQHGHGQGHRGQPGQPARAAEAGHSEADEAERERRQREHDGQEREQLAARRAQAGGCRPGCEQRPENGGDDAQPARPWRSRGGYLVPHAYVILTMSRYMKVSVDLTPSISRSRWITSSRWRLCSHTTSTSRS